jgi:hypothetical protein
MENRSVGIRRLSASVKSAIATANEGHLPVWRQLLEMFYLQVRYRIGPGFYNKAEFWRRDIPLEKKARYRLGQRYLDELSTINDPRYEMVSQNKVCEKAVLSLFAIPTAGFLGHFHPLTGRTGDGAPLRNGKEFLAMLQRRGQRTAVIKRPVGARGIGFDIVDLADHDGDVLFSRAKQTDLTADRYLAEKLEEFGDQGLHIECYVVQHPDMAALNASSVNTLRLWVRQTDQAIEVRSGVLKIGGHRSLTDYTPNGEGGMVAVIDIRSGRLGKIAVRPGPDAASVDTSVLRDFRIPFFAEALELTKQCLAVFPQTQLVGMDIAITPEGPLIIELNNQPDPVHAANVGIPTLDLIRGQALQSDRRQLPIDSR